MSAADPLVVSPPESPESPVTPPGPAPGLLPAPSFRRSATRGLMWMAGQTLAMKVITLGGNVVLAYLVSQRDFGLMGLASTVMAFSMIASQTGLQQILVNRQRHFRRWQNAAVGLSLCLGLAGMASVAVIAPAAAWLYGVPAIVPLLLAQSLALPPTCLAAVPGARLQIDLRFRLLAVVNVVAAVVSTTVSIALAVSDFGAYSIVLGQLASTTVVFLAYWFASGIGVPRRLYVRRWKYLVGDGGWMTATSVVHIVIAQGDYVILGLTQPPEVVGAYYWAFTQSTQASQLVASNLTNVLLPMLSKSGDAVQKAMRYLSAAEVMAYVGVPLCLLQALLARPAVSIIYPNHKWDASIVPLQLLSIAMIAVVAGGHTHTLMQAQGRFRTYFYYAFVSAGVFLACVATAAHLGAAAAVAVGVIVSYFIQATMGLVLAVGLRRETVGKLSSLAFGSILIGGLCAAVAYPAARAAADKLASPHWAYAVVVAPLFIGLYAAVVRVFRPRVWSIILKPRPR